MKNTPISISTSPMSAREAFQALGQQLSMKAASQSDGQPTAPISMTGGQPSQAQKEAANSAALLAFQNLRHQKAMKKAVGQSQTSGQLRPPKVRKQKTEGMREYIDREFKKGPGGKEDIGDPSKTREEVEKDAALYQRRLTAAARAGGCQNGGGEDSLVVWAPEPKAAKMNMNMNMNVNVKAGKDAGLLTHIILHGRRQQKGGQSAVGGGGGGGRGGGGRGGAPKPAGPQSVRHMIAGTAFRIIGTAWWFVEPVFHPQSEVRKRWEQRRLTWHDVGLVAAATFFAVAMFLTATAVAVAVARVVGMGLQLLRVFMAVFKLLF
jgi:hypothetical protein